MEGMSMGSRLHNLIMLTSVMLCCFACGEEPTTNPNYPGMGGSGGRPVPPDYGRYDRGQPKIDMRVQPRMDAGVADRGMPDPTIYIPYGECPEEIDFVGQVTGAGSAVPNGGTPRFNAYERTYDSGLDTVFARLPERGSGDDPMPVSVELQVSRATVVATRPKANPDSTLSTSRARFWVADGRRTMEVFLNLSSRDASPFEIRVGQVISFTARTIGYYGQRPQIQAATNFVLHEDGPADPSLSSAGEVAIFEPDRLLDAEDVPTVVRITGLLEGEGVRCGGDYSCWQMAGPMQLSYRTQESDLRAGTCLSLIHI